MSEAAAPIETRRGYYRAKKRMPRQTAHNRKKKLALEPLVQFESNQPTTSNVGANGTIEFSNEVDLIGDVECCELHYDTANTPGSATFSLSDSDDNVSDDVTNDIINENSANSSTAEILSNNEAMLDDNPDSISPVLYEGSSITAISSLLTLNSFINCHHLTGKAQEDLLHLLHLHLPKPNKLPNSLYQLQKQSKCFDGVKTDLEPKYHYYCKDYYMLFPNNLTTECPNSCCSTVVPLGSCPFFITVSIAEQVKILLSSKVHNVLYK